MLILALPSIASTTSSQNIQASFFDDFDPLVDVIVTVEIETIRSLQKDDPQVHTSEYIDRNGDPDFYVIVNINGETFTSEQWDDSPYLYDIQWTASCDVPDDEEFVDIVIQLWDWNANEDVLCDISGSEAYDVTLQYSIKTGQWTGDDSRTDDPSGYGRLNGCDDGTFYTHDRDCELWFDIYQNDYDNDGLPYWIEVNSYGTDPETNDLGMDDDGDEVPIEWEHRWGYDPTVADDHHNTDPDTDGIDNWEEYRTAQWHSDPFRRDLFTELDQMEESPTGEQSLMPQGSKEILYTAFNRQNVVYHLDDGTWTETGSNMIPFDESTESSELRTIYETNFETDTWRRGVFHYGVLIYQSARVNGNMFGANRFQVSAHGMEEKASSPILNRDIVYASAYMHETGHTLGFWPIPGHNKFSYYPWQLGWWISRPYKSCMNYGYMYTTVDYSDGSRLFNDYNDWERMDLTYFEDSW